MKLKYQILAGLTAILAATACTKTETVDAPALATNRVLEYKITNISGDPIYGVINDEKKTITAYIPYYYYLTSLQPEIEVSDGATVTPGSNTLVEDLDSLFFAAAPLQYTVTAKNGTKATYSLLLETQQPELGMEAPEQDTLLASYTLDEAPYDVQSRYTLRGKNFIVNSALTVKPEVIFLSADNKAYPAVATSAFATSDGVNGSFSVYMPYEANIPEGKYRIRVVNYSRQVILENPVYIAHQVK